MNSAANAVHTLEADGIRLSYGERVVLQSVCVRVSTGRVTGLLGRNGCGKSTLMRIMHGTLDTPDKSVRVDGAWVRRAYMHGVMLASQRGFIPASRTVRGVVGDYRLDFDRLADLFPAFGRHRSSPVALLSGGERRVLEIFAVLTSPAARFCLLDELFSQVSPLHIETIRRIIDEEKGLKGIMVADHTWRTIFDISDDVYVISDGATHPVSSPDNLKRYGYLQ